MQISLFMSKLKAGIAETTVLDGYVSNSRRREGEKKNVSYIEIHCNHRGMRAFKQRKEHSSSITLLNDVVIRTNSVI